MNNRPQATSDDICPFHRTSVKKVCHKCPLFINVKGKDPQSEEVHDRWACSFSWMPQLSVETSQQVRQNTASVDALRTEAQNIGVLNLKQNQVFIRMVADGMNSGMRRIENES